MDHKPMSLQKRQNQIRRGRRQRRGLGAKLPAAEGELTILKKWMVWLDFSDKNSQPNWRVVQTQNLEHLYFRANLQRKTYQNQNF